MISNNKNLLQLDNISVCFDQHNVVDKVSFRLQHGQIGCLLGPSGCGKTTILRAIAGFQKLNAGQIILNNICVSHPSYILPTEKRKIGMVFQDFALFPHLKIADNIGFGIRKQRKKIRQQRIAKLLELINLSGYENRYPHELSGGQQQRIALARALAPKPQLLLMDEPFSSMDAELRTCLARDVRTILHEEHVSAILVTHDQFEAFAMSDQIGLINEGKLMQWDSGYNLYHQPINHFVADFIGQGVLLDGEVIDAHKVRTKLGVLHGKVPSVCQSGCSIEVLLRPDDIQHNDDSPMTARVLERDFRGAEFLYTLALDDGSKILSLVPSHHNHCIGEEIGIQLEVDHLVIFQKKHITGNCEA